MVKQSLAALSVYGTAARAPTRDTEGNRFPLALPWHQGNLQLLWEFPNLCSYDFAAKGCKLTQSTYKILSKE